jgi:CrcB protein
MKALLIVGLGGGIGSIARYMLSVWVLQHTPSWRFPVGTFAVNLIGCFIAGIVLGLAEKRGLFADEWSVFLFVGLLGGFTTFSAFGLETVGLLRRGETGFAATYVVLSVLCGVALLWSGMKAVPLTPP